MRVCHCVWILDELQEGGEGGRGGGGSWASGHHHKMFTFLMPCLNFEASVKVPNHNPPSNNINLPNDKGELGPSACTPKSSYKHEPNINEKL